MFFNIAFFYIYFSMKIKLFKEFSSISNICSKCGEEYWGDNDVCDDCKDSDLEVGEVEKQNIEKKKKHLPFFGVPTTKSQNLYYL